MFDLGALSEWTGKAQRTGRWMVAGFTIFSASLLRVVAFSVARSGTFDAPDFVVLGAAAVFVGCGSIGFRFFGPSPVEARLDARQLEFVYPNRRILTMAWEAAGVRFKLDAWRNPLRLAVGRPYLHTFRPSGLRPDLPITADLFAGIMTEVQRYGLETVPSPSVDSASAPVVTYTVSSAARSSSRTASPS